MVEARLVGKALLVAFMVLTKKTLFCRAVLAGGRAIGQSERNWLATEWEGSVFPRDWPDTRAGRCACYAVVMLPARLT